MEQKYRLVRKHLDELGYAQTLVIDALPLVEKLVSDLVHTTENLEHFKKLAEGALHDRDKLQIGIEPYKCDNAKLVRECNELHLAFLQFKEQSDKNQRDLKIELKLLRQEHSSCGNIIDKYEQQIRDLQYESAKKSDRLINLEFKKTAHGVKTQSKASLKSKGLKSNTAIAESDTMALAEERIAHLSKEIKKLKAESLEHTELLDAYVVQIQNRDREIKRLTALLEGGRPVQAIRKDCCVNSKDGDIRVAHLTDEIAVLQRDKKDLDQQLKESIAKQHEAMKRALHLADRNRRLEKELRDIDQMALAVEAECNTNIKNNVQKVTRLRHRMEDSATLIQRLEKEVAELNREKTTLFSDLETIKLEKMHMHNMLENVLDDKKRMTDRINQNTIIENDLNLEIDRLMQASALQKRKIAELECLLMSDKYSVSVPLNFNAHIEQSKKMSSKMNKKRTASPVKKTTSPIPERKIDKNKRGMKKSGGETIGEKHLGGPRRRNSLSGTESDEGGRKETFSGSVIQLCMEKFQENFEKERDHFRNEIEDLKKQVVFCRENHMTSKENICKYPLQNTSNRKTSLITDREVHADCTCTGRQSMDRINQNEVVNDLKRTLTDKLTKVESLQMEVQSLTREKHDLLSKLEEARYRNEWNNETNGLSAQSTMKRYERERDLARSDAQRLEEEKNMLKDRLKLATETQLGEHMKMQNEMHDLEEKIRKLELERRELVQTEGSKNSLLGSLEGQFQTLKEQLRCSQSELNQQKAYSSQLKTLQEQTDRALADSQVRLSHFEDECRKAKDHIGTLEEECNEKERTVQILKKDIHILKGSLTQIDVEKDGLLMSVDEKTERLAFMEKELKKKENRIQQLDDTVADLQNKLSVATDEHNTRDHLIRSASSETATLKRDLESSLKSNENIRTENRRLQEELSACAKDCKAAHNELEISKRQIDDLKRQLQQYVSEVKRAEDLISQKEIERAEMLDQFRSLSQEATVLESSNNDLETEAAKSKVQLSVTLDHVSELEEKMHSQDAIIQSYESQIAELTGKVASLELKFRHETEDRRRIEDDLIGLRELCMKLDQQKDSLVRQLHEKEDGRSQASREMERLREDQDALRSTLMKDKNTVASLENLLAQSRQETVDQRLLNDELMESVDKYKKQGAELEQKMRATAQQLDLYQEKALEYSQQLKQLRREIANERFSHSRVDDDFTKRYPSL